MSNFSVTFKTIIFDKKGFNDKYNKNNCMNYVFVRNANQITFVGKSA